MRAALERAAREAKQIRFGENGPLPRQSSQASSSRAVGRRPPGAEEATEPLLHGEDKRFGQPRGKTMSREAA